MATVHLCVARVGQRCCVFVWPKSRHGCRNALACVHLLRRVMVAVYLCVWRRLANAAVCLCGGAAHTAIVRCLGLCAFAAPGYDCVLVWRRAHAAVEMLGLCAVAGAAVPHATKAVIFVLVWRGSPHGCCEMLGVVCIRRAGVWWLCAHTCAGEPILLSAVWLFLGTFDGCVLVSLCGG